MERYLGLVKDIEKHFNNIKVGFDNGLVDTNDYFELKYHTEEMVSKILEVSELNIAVNDVLNRILTKLPKLND